MTDPDDPLRGTELEAKGFSVGPQRVDCRWQMVTCRDCGKHYQCTPTTDYFESTTLTDGLCWDCFMRFTGMPPQPEPPYV